MISALDFQLDVSITCILLSHRASTKIAGAHSQSQAYTANIMFAYQSRHVPIIVSVPPLLM